MEKSLNIVNLCTLMYQISVEETSEGPDSYQAVLGQLFPPMFCQSLFSAEWIEDVSQIHPPLKPGRGNNENIVQ